MSYLSDEILGLAKVYNLRIRLPLEYRRIYDIKDGDRILFVKEGDNVYIKKTEGRYSVLSKSSHFPDILRHKGKQNVQSK